MLDQSLLKIITLKYSLSEIVLTQRIEKGFLSENYKVSTRQEDYFLKKYRFDNEAKIKEIHSVKKYFSEKGIPVILPLSTKDEETCFEFDGSYFALFPFVTAVQPERGKLTPNMIISLGKMLGKIHLAGKDCNLKLSESFIGWDKQKGLETVQVLENKLDEIKNKSDFDSIAEKNIKLKKRLIIDNNIKFSDLNLKIDHVIHGDYLDYNVFFDDKGNIKHVFDFEKTKIAPRTQELFRSATYSFLNTDFDEVSISNIKLYIDSYLEVYPMSKEESENGLLAHYLDSIHSFWVEKEHYLKNNQRVDLFLEWNHKRLVFMSERLKELLT